MSPVPSGEQPSQPEKPQQTDNISEKTRPLSDSLPDYTQLYQNQQPPQPQPQSVPQQQYYQQPVYVQPVPMMAVVPKTPQQIAGEQAAQTSLTLGIIGLAITLIYGSFISLILGIIGVKKANDASRLGVPAGGGLATSWISIVLGGIETLFILLPIILVIIGAIAAAASSGR